MRFSSGKEKPKILIFNILGFVVPLGLEPRTP